MAKNQKDLIGSSPADGSGGRQRSFLASENEFDRRTLLRLGSWGLGSITAMIIAVLAHQAGGRQAQVSAADLARQSQQIQSIAKGSENEVRRLSSAIDTLNNDRDHLFARVTVLEQGLDSVTGSISRNTAATPSLSALQAIPPGPPWIPDGPNPDASKTTASVTNAHPPRAAAPVAAAAQAETVVAEPPAAKTPAVKTLAAMPPPATPSPVESSPTSPPSTISPPANLAAAKPPAMAAAAMPATSRAAHDPSATGPGRPDETAAAIPPKSGPQKDAEPHKKSDARNDAKSKGAPIVISGPATAAPPLPPAPIQAAHTDFGIDLGSASSIKGLRLLWRSILKSEAKELTSLHPIIALKERSNGGRGMQLRLVAGPLSDAAEAAKICAVLSENGRTCETAVFNGQRLDMEEGKENATVSATKKPTAWAHAPSRHRHNRRAAHTEEPASQPPPTSPPPPQAAPAPPPQESQPSTLNSFFSR
jgi:hypothetical protein